MRDKVKRFISILMTALMLVNLMPVGALADGITSIGYKPEVAASTGYYTVYVYAKINGTLPEGSTADVNADQWYTLGKISNVYMLNPKNYEFDTLLGYEVGGVSAWSILSNMTPYPKNNNYKKIPWQKAERGVGGNDDFGFKVCSGATDYPSAGTGKTWHLNLLVDITKITPKYNIIYKDIDSGKKIITTEAFGAFQSRRLYTAESTFNHNGRKYKCVDTRPTRTLVFDNVDNVKEEIFYYQDDGPVQYNLTINYRYENENGKLVEEDKLNKKNPDTLTLDHGTWYSVNSPVIPGYTADRTVVDGTLTENTTETVIYRKRTDLSCTVNYYWNGTTTKVADSKTITGQMFGEEVTESPIGADGYTPVSTGPKTITIGTGTNEINFYYYKNVTLTANSDTKTYDGQEQMVEPGYICSEKNVTFDNIAEPSGKGTDAGEYPVTFAKGTVGKVDTSKKYIVTVANPGTLTIRKRSVVLTSETASKEYDGTALEKPVVTVTGDGFVAGEVTDIKATGSVTHVSEGEVTNTITYTEGEKFNADNYDIQKTEGKLSITAATAKVTVTITGNKVTETYDGSEKTAKNYTVSIDNDLYTEDDFTFTGEAEVKATNAGTYDMGLNKSQFKNKNNNFSDSNVEFVVNDGKLVIEKRKVNLSSGTVSKTYDGTPLTSDMVTIEGDGFIEEEAWNVEAIGSVKDVSEGEVTNAITFTKGEKFNEDNYAIEKNEGKLSITPRKVTLTSATLIKDFDGTPLKNGDTPVTETFGTEKAFPDGEGVTYTFTGSQTNAGSSKNMFTYAWNEGTKADNYTICPIEGDLVVTPIDGIKVTITGRKDTQTYDGKPHKVEGYDVKPDNPLFTEKDIEFNGEAEATGTDVRIDPYQMGLKPEQFTNTSNNFTNVEFVVEDGQIVITPRPVTLTSETASKTYDGTPLTRPNVTVSTGENDGFVEGQVTEIKATGSVTNAGSVANTITFTPNKETFKEGNYAITKTEGTLTIAKRSVLITSQSATKTYDGSALTRPAVTITGDGFVPGELAKAEATGSITKVGSTPNAIQYTTTGAFNAANYSIALSVGTLTVTEKPKPEPRRTFNLTINYVYQNGKRAAASYNRGGLKNGETFDITSPVIAGYTASETVVSGTIYNRDIKVTVIYTADGVNLDDYGVPLGLGNITMNVGDCFE